MIHEKYPKIIPESFDFELLSDKLRKEVNRKLKYQKIINNMVLFRLAS